MHEFAIKHIFPRISRVTSAENIHFGKGAA
jgi:hypothetical protein